MAHMGGCLRRWEARGRWELPVMRKGNLLTKILAFGSITIASLAFAQDPASIGQWTAPGDWPAKSIHLQVLPNGKLMFWPSSGATFFWVPVANPTGTLKRSGENTFCSGHSFLADGQMFLAGGHVSGQQHV